MKRIYSTIIIFIVMSLSAYIFAQQYPPKSHIPDQENPTFEEPGQDSIARNQNDIADAEEGISFNREEHFREFLHQFLQKFQADSESFDLRGLEDLEFRMEEFLDENIEKDIEEIIEKHEKLLQDHLEKFREQLDKIKDPENGENHSELKAM